MRRRLLALVLFAAVLTGGVFYGAIQQLDDTGPDW